MSQQSALTVLSRDDALQQWITGVLAPFGWSCLQASDIEAAAAHAKDGAAIILLDGAAGAKTIAAAITEIRALPGFAAGIPAILYAEADFEPVGGMNDRIDPPLDQARFMAMLENWSGPVSDHPFRDAENPQYRMVRLAGRERAASLFAGFARSLTEALNALDEGQNIGRIAHNIAGMAGTMGFAALSKQWSTVDHGDLTALPAAHEAARKVLESLNRSA
ncbi:Hpt domain-containing protein [Sphingobium phenoxybenzoativorans]|uniref:Hpt domain-containing protein n=1 Tax=Sphingobium phenoxybenzoativorans TaxID=1592790 RepID=A0A975Q0Z4_9SPHN|nr:Hpt domain-containing protein [Sphingobium phenoxybenzoativorans]QUT04888.1 Hpt domain-containing protein [Sphingobium phenoxybenzoativorans]